MAERVSNLRHFGSRNLIDDNRKSPATVVRWTEDGITWLLALSRCGHFTSKGFAMFKKSCCASTCVNGMSTKFATSACEAFPDLRSSLQVDTPVLTCHCCAFQLQGAAGLKGGETFLAQLVCVQKWKSMLSPKAVGCKLVSVAKIFPPILVGDSSSSGHESFFDSLETHSSFLWMHSSSTGCQTSIAAEPW